jgi:hypothetical protein
MKCQMPGCDGDVFSFRKRLCRYCTYRVNDFRRRFTAAQAIKQAEKYEKYAWLVRFSTNPKAKRGILSENEIEQLRTDSQ